MPVKQHYTVVMGLNQDGYGAPWHDLIPQGSCTTTWLVNRGRRAARLFRDRAGR